jgi:uncharacterized protein (TIGR02145 family)
MKRFILFTFSILLTFTIVIAQDGINYQGAATDANGDELTNQNISIKASVLSTSANGNLEWEETHSATTDQFGLFNVVIGQGTNTTNGATANFDDMDWGSGNHFLKIEMDATGGTNYAMIGTTQMMSVPYALYAKSAGSSSGSMSVSTFGDTLTMNGQSIIVPGLSYQNLVSGVISSPTFGSVTDASGNSYPTMDYGPAGEWMTENLITEKYDNGDPIPMMTSGYHGVNNAYASWTWSENSYTNEAIYGKMYNGIAVYDSRSVCPSGWHIPSLSEWVDLFNLFGNTASSNNYTGGDALKSVNISSGNPWSGGGTGVSAPTNESYMSIVGAGHNGGAYGSQYTSSFKEQGRYYTSNQNGAGSTSLEFVNGEDGINERSEMNYYFFSVRCKKD